MELIILTIGLQLGIIDQQVFGMMVVMALVTTAFTAPLLTLVYPQRMLEELLTPAPATTFAVLIPVAAPRSGGPLLRLAAMLSGANRDQGHIYPLHLDRPSERDMYRAGWESTQSQHAFLAPLIQEARQQKVEVDPLSFVSRDVPSDIARVARLRKVDLILMGHHKPVFGRTILGGTVHRVMTASDCDVAIFVQRHTDMPQKLLVPYRGSAHDKLAVELAGRMARHGKVQVTVLRVVAPTADNATGDGEGPANNGKHIEQDIKRLLTDMSSEAAAEVKTVAHTSPVDAVLSEAPNFDLMVVGVSEEWGLESHLFGWYSERIAAESRCSLLIVRKFVAPVPVTVEADEEE
jgi:nucleotide-binding universal stress UspA family protein